MLILKLLQNSCSFNVVSTLTIPAFSLFIWHLKSSILLPPQPILLGCDIPEVHSRKVTEGGLLSMVVADLKRGEVQNVEHSSDCHRPPQLLPLLTEALDAPPPPQCSIIFWSAHHHWWCFPPTPTSPLGPKAPAHSPLLYLKCTYTEYLQWCICSVPVVHLYRVSTVVCLKCTWVYLKCTWSVLEVYLKCAWSVLEVYLKCTWSVPECTGSVLEVYLKCTWSVLEVYLKCTTAERTCRTASPLTQPSELRARIRL